jgi:hypothetical protein
VELHIARYPRGVVHVSLCIVYIASAIILKFAWCIYNGRGADYNVINGLWRCSNATWLTKNVGIVLALVRMLYYAMCKPAPASGHIRAAAPFPSHHHIEVLPAHGRFSLDSRGSSERPPGRLWRHGQRRYPPVGCHGTRTVSERAAIGARRAQWHNFRPRAQAGAYTKAPHSGPEFNITGSAPHPSPPAPPRALPCRPDATRWVTHRHWPMASQKVHTSAQRRAIMISRAVASVPALRNSELETVSFPRIQCVMPLYTPRKRTNTPTNNRIIREQSFACPKGLY